MLGTQMRHHSMKRFFGRGLAGAPSLESDYLSAHRTNGAGRALRCLSRITHPFQRSIHVRFQSAFALSVLGLLLMAVITIVSSRAILDTYALSVKETRLELMPVHLLQVDLREVDHSAYRYAIEGDRSALNQFTVLAAQVDERLAELAKVELQMGSVEHAHAGVSLPNATKAWEHAKLELKSLFLLEPGSPQSIQALKQAHLVIDPIYDAMNEYHHLSMQDLRLRLQSAQTVGEDAFLVMIGAIVVGLVVLIGMGSFVGRSVLLPIAELREAARKLGERDFSYRIRLHNTSDELGELAKSINMASATLQELYRELERRSTHDGLTGVLNRAAFDERLMAEFKGASRHNRSLSLLMVDIDFFKRVNDTLGHQAGDEVLKSVATILTETTRPGDVVARYGGEEFAVILPETSENSAIAMAERLRVAVENARIEYGASGGVSLTVSVGCASQLPHAGTPKALVKAADAALYCAKDTGRNRVSSAREVLLGDVPKQQTDAALDLISIGA